MSAEQANAPVFPACGLFVAGTDTDVGKTYVACRIIEELVNVGTAVAAYKPVASGSDSPEQSDAQRLYVASSHRGALVDVNPQFFRAPLAPPVAAAMENRQVDEQRILAGAAAWKGHCDCLIVEGAGGLLSPISWSLTNADLAVALGYPVVLVAANRLGVVNHTLLSMEHARGLGVHVLAVVLNDVSDATSDQSRRSNESLLRKFFELKRFDVPICNLSYDNRSVRGLPGWSSILETVRGKARP